MTHAPLLLLPLLLAAGCALGAPERPPTTDERIAAECSLLATAAQRMVAPPPGLFEGCPGAEGVQDTRPVEVQTNSLRMASAAPLPQGVMAGTRAETVFRRMITRGVAPGLAAQLTGSPEFAAAIR